MWVLKHLCRPALRLGDRGAGGASATPAPRCQRAKRASVAQIRIGVFPAEARARRRRASEKFLMLFIFHYYYTLLVFPAEVVVGVTTLDFYHLCEPSGHRCLMFIVCSSVPVLGVHVAGDDELVCLQLG